MMKQLFLIAILIMPFKLFSQDALPESKISYRPPTVAGSFYPSDPDSLRSLVEGLLKLDEPGRVGYLDIFAIVAPHAGYVYSGKIAARAYKELKDKEFDVAVIIAPSHHEAFKGSSVFSGDAYVTPLGNAMVDKQLAREVAESNDGILLSMAGHRWTGVTPEHSIEVHLPFIQILFPNIKIIPIVMGSQDIESQDRLVRGLSKVLRNSGKKYLIIASTDLSHFYEAEKAEEKDKSLVRAYSRYDYFAMQNLFATGEFEACGSGPLTASMMLAEQLGANSALPVMYLHSGNTDAGKDRQDSVVGYFSGLFVRGEGSQILRPALEENDKVKLMELVIKSVRNVSIGYRDTTFYGMVPRNLAQYSSAFVTLKKNKELRACMGHTYAQKPVFLEVQTAAELAATSDYRFGPVKTDEIDELEYEITVMSRMMRVLDIETIEVGRDGLFIRRGDNRGLLLPQVASERNWDVKTFLENLSVKAGLDKNAYLDDDTQIFRFEADIFNNSELPMNGE